MAARSSAAVRGVLAGIASTLLSLAPVSHAQQTPASGPYARIVVIQPHPGHGAAFREGYRRHLDWHREANDPWTWLGWRFVLGERLGLFMDGTFGHAAEAFDHAVDPAGDAADNAANVIPHADFLSHGFYERLDTLSVGPPLPDTSPYLAVTTYFLDPGGEQVFRSLIAARRAEVDDGERYTWMRLRIGGRGPQYLLLRAVPTFGDAAGLPDFLVPDGAGNPRAETLHGAVESFRHELLKYEPGLSYRP